MFEYLSRYLNILVTGPQRSGTRITTKMIAHDLKYRFVDEDEIQVSDLSLILLLIDTKSHLVIQCPALCHQVHELSRSDSAVVIVKRPLDQILRSQKRIGWDFNDVELRKYGITTGGTSAIVKYDYWNFFQRRRIHNPFEVEYEDLKSHPLWVDPEQRKNFKWNQTEMGGPSHGS
jgi:hypothetical protein